MRVLVGLCPRCVITVMFDFSSARILMAERSVNFEWREVHARQAKLDT